MCARAQARLAGDPWMSMTATSSRAASRLRLVPSAEQMRMAWKNGGGFTTEVAARPAGASLDTFDWRVSTAQVAADGPFSLFPGIDRTLLILEGAGLLLTIDDASPVHVTDQSAPFAFAADKPTHASLIDGPIVDLNVMSRRRAWRHTVERLGLQTRRLTASGATDWLVYCRTGSVCVSVDGDTAALNQHDAVVCSSPQATIELEEPSAAYLIEFHRQ